MHTAPFMLVNQRIQQYIDLEQWKDIVQPLTLVCNLDLEAGLMKSTHDTQV